MLGKVINNAKSLCKNSNISVFLTTFAAMKLENRRHIASWLLLAVFVPMLVFSSLHVHEDSKSTALTECADCVHHNCHGHLTQTASWMHDCVLCQFLTLIYVAIGTISLIIINKVVNARINAPQHNVYVAFRGIVGLRAPPAFSI